MLTEPREALLRRSTFELVAGQPGRMDMTTVHAGDPTPLYSRGIYALQGDVLTYCVGAPGQARPAAFAAGKGETLVVLRRAAPAGN